MFRKTLFWIHLACGIAAAFGVITMSVTGVLLTYERQIMHWMEQQAYVPEAQQVDRLSLEQLVLRAEEINSDLTFSTVLVNNDPGAPVVFRAGRRGGVSLNPYTGEEMAPAAPRLDAFFSSLTGFHRWFNVQGENRQYARMVTGVSNLIFLFLVCSGLYLWLPKVWKWAVFRTRLFFNKNAKSSKARDFVWHHVFGFWSAIPLIIIVASGSVFSYRWTGDLLYRAFGTERPGAATQPEQQDRTTPVETGNYLTLDELLISAQSYNDSWKQITLTLPEEIRQTASLSVDRGNGGQPQLRDNLTVDRLSGQIVEIATFDSLPLSQRIRSTNRFIHTGEYLGIIGQTIAGIVSFTSLIMVWTGLALSYRRLIQPLLRRRKSPMQPGDSRIAQT